MSQLNHVRDVISDHMDQILREFKPGAKITVIVRTEDGEREPGRKDFMMTNDEIGEVRKLVERRIAARADDPHYNEDH